jgi:hypothetical protein
MNSIFRSLATLHSSESTASGFATVAGFKPEELTVTIEEAETPVLKGEPAPVIPVSTPKRNRWMKMSR